MSTAASNYTENLALKWLLTSDSATRPTAWYVALFTSNPDEDGSGTEVSGTNYVRKSVSFSVTTNTATNSGAVTFDAAGSGGWGTISHIGVYDASSSGNLLFYGAVTTSKTIEEGDTFQISTSNLTIQLD